MQQHERLTGSANFEVELYAVDRFDPSPRLCTRHIHCLLQFTLYPKNKTAHVQPWAVSCPPSDYHGLDSSPWALDYPYRLGTVAATR